jgi:hypothetical protein
MRMPIREVKLWVTLGVIMLLFSINRALDLQDLMTGLIRDYAERDGWYMRRQHMQVILVLTMLGIGGFILFVAIEVGRMFGRGLMIALGGMAILIAFYLVRSISLHAADAFFARPLMGITINSLIENGAIVIVALGAWMAGRSPHISTALRHRPPNRPSNLGRRGP